MCTFFMELDEKSKREIRDANKRKEMIGVILDLFNQVDSLLSDVINGYFTRERLKERRQFSELILDLFSSFGEEKTNFYSIESPYSPPVLNKQKVSQ